MSRASHLKVQRGLDYIYKKVKKARYFWFLDGTPCTLYLLIKCLICYISVNFLSDFFFLIVVPEDVKDDEVDDELRNLLTTDYEIGHYLRERIVPRAVLYYTGEGIEDEDDFEEEEEEDDEEEEEDSDKEVFKKESAENCKQQ